MFSPVNATAEIFVCLYLRAHMWNVKTCNSVQGRPPPPPPKPSTLWHAFFLKGRRALEFLWYGLWLAALGINQTRFNVFTIVLIKKSVCLFLCPQMLQEVVAKALKHHGITAEHECFEACSKRLFDISKFYLKVSLFTADAQSALLFLFDSLFGCPRAPGTWTTVSNMCFIKDPQIKLSR